jgi:hypothetical protein
MKIVWGIAADLTVTCNAEHYEGFGREGDRNGTVIMASPAHVLWLRDVLALENADR